ncbi:hypothetical protein AHMF7605_28330 [Adhaeribacter arboris]|uniref:Uncharacterized protein n=1 Tax=Adhaeribacter arboris TaxID=2072846 RepID=A0A2T2YNQ8_9BACT|nr:hypothetical protein AHMF7605_28330 [Adhaeribacter arboris]
MPGEKERVINKNLFMDNTASVNLLEDTFQLVFKSENSAYEKDTSSVIYHLQLPVRQKIFYLDNHYASSRALSP